MPRKVFKRSLFQVLLQLFGGFIMVGASLLILLFGLGSDATILVRLGMLAVGLIGTVFFGFCMLVIIKQMFRRRPMFVLDETGFTDNTAATSLGFVSWQDVTDIYINSLFGQSFICVELANEEDYLAKQSAFRRYLFHLSHKLGYPAVAINCNLLPVTARELQDMMRDYYNKAELTHS